MQTLNNVRWLDLNQYREDRLSPRAAGLLILALGAAGWALVGAVLAVIL